MANQDDKFKKVISHAKEYGYVFQSSEIYDGLSAVYDYAQNGVELKNNIRDYWWRAMVQMNENIVGLDAAIFMHPTTWKASGHVDAFNDPLIDNKDSKKRYRADVLIEDYCAKIETKINKEVTKAAKRFGDAFNKEEVKEKQRRINLSLLADEEMEKKLGFTINIPSAYRISKASDDFFWIRKNLSNAKTIELMIYEVPLETISKGDSTIIDVVKMRNKITKSKIPGEDDIYMVVEDAYAPALFNTIIDNKPAYEVRGIWEMEGYTMAGPFITYAIVLFSIIVQGLTVGRVAKHYSP